MAIRKRWVRNFLLVVAGLLLFGAGWFISLWSLSDPVAESEAPLPSQYETDWSVLFRAPPSQHHPESHASSSVIKLPSPTSSIPADTDKPSSVVHLHEPMTACVPDPAGNHGLPVQIMEVWQRALREAGGNVQIVVNHDVKVVRQGLETGKCHMALLLGSDVRELLPFPGSVEAIGALRAGEETEILLKILHSNPPAFQDVLKNKRHVLLGVAPVGMTWLLLAEPDSLETIGQALSGIDMATTDSIESAFAAHFGATPHRMSRPNAFTRFNNGSIAAVVATLQEIEDFELEKGLRPHGMLRLPLHLRTWQLVGRAELLPADFVAWSRGVFQREVVPFAQAKADERMREASVKFWSSTTIPEAQEEQELRQLRLQLAGQGLYDEKMLTLLRKVRCKTNHNREECWKPVE